MTGVGVSGRCCGVVRASKNRSPVLVLDCGDGQTKRIHPPPSGTEIVFTGLQQELRRAIRLWTSTRSMAVQVLFLVVAKAILPLPTL